MWYHWGYAPGHLYMYQGDRTAKQSRKGHLFSTTTTAIHQTANSRAENIAPDQDHNASFDAQDITFDEYAQMGSDSDDADSDFNGNSSSDQVSSSAGSETDSGRSERSLEDDDDNNWEEHAEYED